MKKKIYFVINNNIYVRNFIKTNILKKLNKKFNVNLIFNKELSKEITNIKNFNKNKIFFYSSSDKDGLLLKYHDLKSTCFKKNSKFFKFRLLRLYRFDLRYLNEILLNKNTQINTINKILNFHYLVKNFFLFIIFKILSTSFFFPYVKKFISKLPQNDSIEKLIKKTDGQIFIVPTSGYDADTIHFIDLLKKNKKKSYLIVDNWDNLSSKIVLDNLPDRIAVWGAQTKMHANKIQNINTNQIKVLGSARSELLFTKRHKNQKPRYKNYILFLGSAWAWDEEGVLTMIDNFFIKNKINNLQIIYRPHPFRQRKTIISNSWKYIKIDKQLYDNKRKKFLKRSWPELDYYPSLIQNSKFIIGGLTSMMIESTIFWKSYLAIGFDDNFSLMNQKNALKYFTHLEGIEKLPNLKICRNVNRFYKDLNYIMKNHIHKKPSKKMKINIDKKREFFLSGNNSTYTERLVSDINKFSKIF